jgi:hypothetical protein
MSRNTKNDCDSGGCRMSVLDRLKQNPDLVEQALIGQENHS